jgi:hypothetical protein
MRRHGVWDADRVQAALNVLGGAAFVAGSVLFLLPAGFAPGIALFTLGSLAMFVGSVLAWRARYGAPGRAATDATVYAPADAAADAAAEAAELPGSAATTSSDAPAVGAWPLIAGELPSAPEAPASAPLPGPVRGTARAGFRAPVRMPWGRALRRR